MAECSQEMEKTSIPTKCRDDVSRLRDFADRLHHHSRWCAAHKVAFEKQERTLRKAMEKAAAKQARAKQAYKQAADSWRMAHDELAGVLQGLWMEQMESDMGDALNRFADSIGDIRQMAAACQDFINLFADSVRWHVLYATCEDKEVFSSYASKVFSCFRNSVDHAWAYLSEFTVSDKVRTARTALYTLLACWTYEFTASGKDRKFLSLDYMRQWRDEFSRALVAVREQLNNPETFFVQVEKEATHTETDEKTTPHTGLLNELKQCVDESLDGIKLYIARRTRTHKKGTAPGPKMTPTHYNDLKRVHEYVKQGHALYKACGIVDAENKESSGNGAHYGSAESMRSEYPKWLERERKAGREG